MSGRTTATAWLCLVVVVSLTGGPVWAAEVRDNRVRVSASAFVVNFEAELEVSHGEVAAIINDFRNLHRITRYVVASRVTIGDGVGSSEDDLLEVVLRGCVLVFCREVIKASRVAQPDAYTLVFTIDPARGDFASGHERLELRPAGGRTRVLYEAVLVPRFRVPSLIVPRLMAAAMRRELARTALRLEQLASGN